MSEAIIVSIIGGSFALLGTLFQGKKCCYSNNNIDGSTAHNPINNLNHINNRPLQILNTIYEVPNGNISIFDSKYIEIFDSVKYKIRVQRRNQDKSN